MIPKKSLFLLFAWFCLFPAFMSAQGSGGGGAPPPSDPPVGASDDTYWSDGANPPNITHLDVTDNPNGGVWTTSTSAGGFTSAETGSQGALDANGNPTCWNSDVMTAPDGTQTRVRNGKLQKKVNGKWVTQKPIKKPKKPKQKTNNSTQQQGIQRMNAGDPAPCPGKLWSMRYGSTHLALNEPAPFSGYFSPADDVVSLPSTGTPSEEGTSLPVTGGGPTRL